MIELTRDKFDSFHPVSNQCRVMLLIPEVRIERGWLRQKALMISRFDDITVAQDKDLVSVNNC